MGERKVLNKYIPPDFDPAKVPRGKRPADGQIKVRMMLPMSICCQTCGNFISKGTKFNSRKEDAKGETYLGLRIFRFYFRCPRCSGEIAMKTDPERSDYIGTSDEFEFECLNGFSLESALAIAKGRNGFSGFSRTSFVFSRALSSLSLSLCCPVLLTVIIIIITTITTTVESGASRNYEPWKGEKTANELKERERREAEEGDEMKKLENKTKASKREMDLNAALDEMKSLSARHARMDFDGVVANVAKMGEREREKREMEEEMRAKKMYEMAVRESKAREEKKQQQQQRERGEDARTNTNNDNKSADEREHKKLEDIYSEDEEEKEARDAEEARLRRRKIIEDVGEEHGTKKTFEKENTKTKKKLAIQRVATSADAKVEKEEAQAPVVPPSALLAQHYSSSSE
jgi:hypothetical protein